MNDEICPPEWVLAGANRLTMEEFGKAFVENWRLTTSGLFKVEAWQTYQEPDTQSLRVFEQGDFAKVRSFVESEAQLDGFVYDDVRNKGRSFVRARIVKLPLSRYLEWEFWNYRIRMKFGEIVKVVDQAGSDLPLPNHSYFDFLLFDGSRALVHDYGQDGLQVGGWEVTSSEAIKRLTRVSDDLRSSSVDLEEFIATNGVVLRGTGQVV